jgi:hypothetical protein
MNPRAGAAMLKIRFCLPALLAFSLLIPVRPSFGWGARGHRVAAKVAMKRLTPAAKQAIAKLLNEGDTLPELAGWADGSEAHRVEPKSAPWHYVNVPITASKYDNRYCADRGCVVSKIKEYRAILTDPRTKRADRQRALLFLVHLIEDLHQPLHVGDNHDRGGNSTQVRFFDRGDNLHRVWDSGVIEHQRWSDGRWIEQVEKQMTPANVKAWSSGKVEDWATESLQAAKLAYDPTGRGHPIATGANLGEEYETFALPIISQRLAQTGVRLANELNAIFP